MGFLLSVYYFFFIETVEKEMGHFFKNFISNWKYKYSNLDVLATK